MTVFEHPLEDIQYAIGETKKDPSDADELMVILKNAELYEAVKNIASYELSKEELLKVVSFARFIKSESDSSL